MLSLPGKYARADCAACADTRAHFRHDANSLIQACLLTQVFNSQGQEMGSLGELITQCGVGPCAFQKSSESFGRYRC